MSEMSLRMTRGPTSKVRRKAVSPALALSAFWARCAAVPSFRNAAADTARLLCLKVPETPEFFLQAAFCLHETGDTLAARDWLLRGPKALIKDPLFQYNMACYLAVLGPLP